MLVKSVSSIRTTGSSKPSQGKVPEDDSTLLYNITFFLAFANFSAVCQKNLENWKIICIFAVRNKN